jgi:hypothetical protein
MPNTEIELRPGDIFCSRNPMALGRIICAVERWYSKDNQAEYSHAGIITSAGGMTLEALWTVKPQNIFIAYKDTKVLICRHELMTDEAYWKGYNAIRQHIGQVYPFWRLGFALYPPFAKYINFLERLVCSEITGKFYSAAGIPGWECYHGLTPDDIADRGKTRQGSSVIHEGVI